MRTLAREVGRGISAGEPIPAPWPIFSRHRADIRRGAITMIAGPPGSMKSTLMLNIVDRSRVPTLYFSSDSDSYTMASRVLAMRTGEHTSETEQWTKSNVSYAQKILREWSHVAWSFHSAPNLVHINTMLEAFTEVHGQPPHHTVVDILMDVDYEGAGEQNYWSLMSEFKLIAREYETALTLVHHTSEGVKGEPCPPRSAIMGKANQLPALILTCNGDSINGKIDIAVVKNRFGPQDPTGRTSFQMEANPSQCKIDEYHLEPPKMPQQHQAAALKDWS